MSQPLPTDPHGTRYDCERAALALGDMSDDELANGAFLNYDQRLSVADMLSPKPGQHMPIVWMTAVKDRIRWLSRKLAASERERERAAPLADIMKLLTEARESLYDRSCYTKDGDPVSEKDRRNDATITRINAALAAAAPVAPLQQPARKWTGPGHLEQTGYIPAGSAAEREAASQRPAPVQEPVGWVSEADYARLRADKWAVAEVSAYMANGGNVPLYAAPPAAQGHVCEFHDAACAEIPPSMRCAGCDVTEWPPAAQARMSDAEIWKHAVNWGERPFIKHRADNGLPEDYITFDRARLAPFIRAIIAAQNGEVGK